MVQHVGQVDVYKRKAPNEWPLGETKGTRHELAQILVNTECNSLVGKDILASCLNPTGKYSTASRYLELDRQVFGSVWVSWQKQVCNKFSCTKYNFFMWLVVQNRCLTWDNSCKRGFHLDLLFESCVIVLKSVFLIFSFNALFLGRCISSGEFGIRLVGMPHYWLIFGTDGVGLQLKLLLFRSIGLLGLLSLFGIFGQK